MSMAQPGNAGIPTIDLLILIHASEQNLTQEALAVELAERLRGRVHLLGLAVTAHEKAIIIPKLDEIRERLRAAGLVVSVSVESDPPAVAIRTLDPVERPRLIVVGALGRKGLVRRLLGPIALDLLDAVADSLLFVPPGPQVDAPIRVERILLAIGALSYSLRAVDAAALLAQAYGAQITLLHIVVPNKYTPDALAEPTNMRDFLASESLFANNFRRAITQLEDHGVVVTPRLRQGSPLHQVLAESRSTPYDLAVIGSHYSAGSMAQLLGGISQSIVRQAGIPVLVARGELDTL